MRLLRYASAAVAALALGGAASLAMAQPSNAGSSTQMPITDFDGSYGSFGANVDGDFNDDFTFNTAYDGLGSVSVTAASVTGSPGISFMPLYFNNTMLTEDADGDYEANNVDVTKGMQDIYISGSGNGSFAGSVAFTPAAPEPSSWALMIAGIGGIGLMLRRRRQIGAGLGSALLS